MWSLCVLIGLMKDNDVGKTQKVRTVSIDTDVLNDLVAESLGHSTSITKQSFETFSIITARGIKLELVGSPVVRKELQRVGLEKFYDVVFDSAAKVDKNVKRLAKIYVEKLNIKGADALIIASVSLARIDVLFSRDRTHITNDRIREGIKAINDKRKIWTPLLMTPSELIERVFIWDRCICVSGSIVPLRLRPRISYPK